MNSKDFILKGKKFFRDLFILLQYAYRKCGFSNFVSPTICDIYTSRPINALMCNHSCSTLKEGVFIQTDSPHCFGKWQLIDYENVIQAQGHVFADNTGYIELSLPTNTQMGFYELILDFQNNIFKDSIIVLPPINKQNFGGLFGMSGGDLPYNQWEIFSQIGVRHLRLDENWPENEPIRDEWHFEHIQQTVANAYEYNLQLSLMTAYTPRHRGLKPINGIGRPATATHTWQPKETQGWNFFVDGIAEATLGQKLVPLTNCSRGLPLLLEWECWSEADQNFYYGDWGRYLDMLRILYCRVKKESNVPIVYGSCGHMTEMVLTLRAACGDYFDRIAYHPGGEDPNYELMHWYRNMPQKLLREGIPRRSSFTECYFGPINGSSIDHAVFQLKLYSILKEYREDIFVRSGSLGHVVSNINTPQALLWNVDGKISPQPPYMAFAMCRWLLEDAIYVGNCCLGENIEAKVFIKQGKPMMVIWSNVGEKTITVKFAGVGFSVSTLGPSKKIKSKTKKIKVDIPMALLNVDWAYVAEAFKEDCFIQLSTELGHVREFNPQYPNYVKPLQTDIEVLLGADALVQLNSLISLIEEGFINQQIDYANLFLMMELLGDFAVTIIRGLAKLPAPQQTNTIWRLNRWIIILGQIINAVSNSPHDVQELNNVKFKIDNMEDLCYPFSYRIFNQAKEQIDLIECFGQGQAILHAAAILVDVAESIKSKESSKLNNIFMVVEFPTSQPLVKGVLLPPGDHVIDVLVYNMSKDFIKGVFEVLFPEEWDFEISQGSFEVAPDNVSRYQLCFSITTEPKPWVEKEAYTPYSKVPVVLPQGISPNHNLKIEAHLDSGLSLQSMNYLLCIGEYINLTP